MFPCVRYLDGSLGVSCLSIKCRPCRGRELCSSVTFQSILFWPYQVIFQSHCFLLAPSPQGDSPPTLHIPRILISSSAFSISPLPLASRGLEACLVKWTTSWKGPTPCPLSWPTKGPSNFLRWRWRSWSHPSSWRTSLITQAPIPLLVPIPTMPMPMLPMATATIETARCFPGNSGHFQLWVCEF